MDDTAAGEDNVEWKRMQYIKKLSLAQRLGLVERPQMPLSAEEWQEVERQSLKRNPKFTEPCPICYEDLKLRPQSILSCSHVFHGKCLESFERFTRERVCPICRKKDYDKKVFIEGQKSYIVDCVKRIQKVGRGFLARNKFYEGLKQTGYMPKQGPLRRKLIGYKLSRVGRKYTEQMNKERQRILGTVKEVDKSIEDTEKLLESFLPNMARIWEDKRREAREKARKEEEEGKVSRYWEEIKNKAV